MYLLDAFAYDGLFGIRAALAGAEEVLCLEQNAKACERLKANAEGGDALVVGHSNTVPDLLRALGLEDVADMTDREYDHVFIVRLDELGRSSLTHLHH